MAENGDLIQMSVQFTVDLAEYYKWLVNEKREYIFSRQIMRSGSSIGANVHEAIYASSKADFAAKLQIALKEASETLYWFIVLKSTGYLPDNLEKLRDQCESLKRIMIASIKTAKNNIAKQAKSKKKQSILA